MKLIKQPAGQRTPRKIGAFFVMYISCFKKDCQLGSPFKKAHDIAVCSGWRAAVCFRLEGILAAMRNCPL